jgi:hypothetical protein
MCCACFTVGYCCSCAAGGAAEMLAKELHSALRENVTTSGGGRGPAAQLFEDCLVTTDSGGRSRQSSRPLLLIFERGADFFPVLQHTSTYQVCIGS